MGNNGNGKNVIELGGYDFARASYGLDEEQVASFVNELKSQRDTFLHRQEHLSSLTKLAERTIAEAGNMAKQIKEEAIEQANAEATAIIAKAEEQAQQMIEEKRTEVIAMANRKAEAIRAKAQRQAELLLGEKARSIQIKLKDMTHSLYRQFLSQLEGLQQQVITLETDFEHTLFQTMKQLDPIIERGRSSQFPILDAGASTQLKDGILAKAVTQDQAVDQLNYSEPEEKTLASTGIEEAVDYNGEVELEIMSPVDLKHILELMKYLDSLPEVETTELIPIVDKPSIIVFLHEPVPLIEILKTLPEVEQAEEIIGAETASLADTPQIKRKKIRMTLSKDRILTEAKEVLTSDASNTQTSKPHPNLK
jgi:hypothetical protein